MNKKQRNLAAYLFLSLLVTFLLFTLLKINLLEEELAHARQKGHDLNLALTSQQELIAIDSMLVDGEDYSGALRAYQSKFEGVTEENEHLEWRLALTKKLVDLQNNQPSRRIKKEEQVEELPVKYEPNTSVLHKEDSLRFALEKTKTLLERAKKQLQKKSFGEYLTFATKKGNQLHYVGEVRHGQANGFGIALLNSGSRYKGQWKDNERHGFGTFYWSDGQYYEGEYENDLRNGEGTYYWPNGEKYVGHWKNDERWGEGIFYDKDGNPMARGIWRDDKLVNETKASKKQTEIAVTATL